MPVDLVRNIERALNVSNLSCIYLYLLLFCVYVTHVSFLGLPFFYTALWAANTFRLIARNHLL